MANHQIEMRKVKKIFKLYTEGVSKRQISSQLGISRNTVAKYIAFFQCYKLTQYEVSAMTLEELHRLFKSGQKKKSSKQKTLEQYFPYFDKELRKTGVTKQLLWEEYISKHPEGFKLSQFRYWYREWSKEVSPVMNFTHKAGDKLFIDFTGKKLTIVDEHTGEIQELEVFVCVLGSSQFTYVEACESQKKADFIRCTENALWYYGGVPDALVTDNLRAAVTKSSRFEPLVNETFADFAEYYETAVLPTRAYKPRDKAIVENAVRIIYTRVFAPLRNQTFHSKAALNKAILTLLEQHNKMSFRGRDYSRYSLFEDIEKHTLNPLPVKKYELKQYAKGTVHKNSHVCLNKDKHYYSVPYKNIGNKIKIIYSDSLIEIYHKQVRIAVHSRNKKKYGYTTTKEHMPSHHQFVSEWSSEKFITWAANIGTDCEAYIIKILDKKQHPEQSYKSCLGILHLAKKVSKERLNNACKRALDYGAYNYNMIQRILDKGWDDRLNRKIERLTKAARFRYRAVMEDIDYHHERHIDKNKIQRFTTCDFIKNKENILITGSTGVGKSYMASAIGHQACSLGYKVMYFNTHKLFTKLRTSKADGSYSREINKIEKQDLLILDDFGLRALDSINRNYFMEIIEDRHGKRTTIIASQLPVEAWHQIIGEQTIADAILDRLVHSAHRIDIKGESMRKKLRKKH